MDRKGLPPAPKHTATNALRTRSENVAHWEAIGEQSNRQEKALHTFKERIWNGRRTGNNTAVDFDKEISIAVLNGSSP
jgi:hypothetical protein